MATFTPKQREQLDAMARKIRERREQATGRAPQRFQLSEVWDGMEVEFGSHRDGSRRRFRFTVEEIPTSP